MSITLVRTLLLITVTTAIGTIIGSIFFAFSALLSFKKYQAYILELKRQDKYQEWIERNKGQRFFLKIVIGFVVLFLLALMVTFVKEFVSMPRAVLMISRILVYAFYPFTFITILISYWLHRKTLKELSKQIDHPETPPN